MELARKLFAAATAGATVLGLALPVLAQDLNALLNQVLNYLQQNPQVVQQVAQQVAPQLAGAPAECQGVTFTRNLRYGMRGNDVKCLQALLGVEPKSGYFGAKTRAAVIKFQEDNAAEILTPLGLKKGTGIVGPSTRKVLNKKLGAAVPTVSVEEVQKQAPSLVEAFTNWLKGLVAQEVEKKAKEMEAAKPVAGEEGALTVVQKGIPQLTLYNGDQNKDALAFKVKAKGSDITLERVKVVFSASNNAAVYKYLSYAALYDGSNAIKGVTLSKETMVKEASGYAVNFTGLGVKVAKDSTKEITLKVSAVPVYPDTPSITVTVPAKGVRGVDGAGLSQYAPESDFSATITLEKAPSGTVKASLASDNPKEGVALVSTESDTEVTLLKFTLTAKNTDVVVDKITVSVANTSNISAVKLYDGSQELDSETASTSVTFNGWANDGLAISIAKDASKTLTVKVVVPATTSVSAGTNSASVTKVEGTDANDNGFSVTVSDVTGSTQHFYTKAPQFTFSAGTPQQSGTQRIYTYPITLKVKALGGDIYVAKTATTTSGATGAIVAVEDPTDTTTTETAGTVNASGCAATDGTWCKVAKDTEATLTFSVVIDNTGTGATYALRKVKINAIYWGENASIGINAENFMIKDMVTPEAYF